MAVDISLSAPWVTIYTATRSVVCDGNYTTTREVVRDGIRDHTKVWPPKCDLDGSSLIR